MSKVPKSYCTISRRLKRIRVKSQTVNLDNQPENLEDDATKGQFKPLEQVRFRGSLRNIF